MKLKMILTASLLFTFCFMVFSCQPALAAADVTIVSHSSFYNSLDMLYVVGEVENTGDVATEFTKVIATFYDSQDQIIGNKTGYATLDVLLPGRKSLFNILLLPEDGAMDVSRYTLTVAFSEYDETKPQGLEILSSEQSIDVMDYLHVTGEIKNTASTTATDVYVSATFYDSTGTVIGRNWELTAPSDLAAGETGTFDIELIYPHRWRWLQATA